MVLAIFVFGHNYFCVFIFSAENHSVMSKVPLITAATSLHRADPVLEDIISGPVH